MMKQLVLMKEVLLGEVLLGGWWEVLVVSHLEYIEWSIFHPWNLLGHLSQVED